jgi:hypothetical protein
VLGFETIGNATLICFDGKPRLVTDPWINDSAYFGSWGVSFEIPKKLLQHIQDCEYVWFSHGHPDHLNGDSLPSLSNKKILLPDHVGGRIRDGLIAQGFQTIVLPDKTWFRISPQIEVLCLADYFQDAILLVRIGNRLVMDFNDAAERGWTKTVRNIARRFPENYLLKISGYGDADMINLFDEAGSRIEPWASRKYPVGRSLAESAKAIGASHVVPFSSFHCYRRTDSVWAEQYTTPMEAYTEGFALEGSELLPAFIRVDCATGQVERLEPSPAERTLRSPESCGDSWGELLNKEDQVKLRHYFTAKRRLYSHLRFLRFRVGGSECFIDLNPRKQAGITFEAPRHSLITAVEFEVFDDLLIGNFMKTTLHGFESLYPWFTPPVAKYADNGRAQTRTELLHYFARYLLRNPAGFLSHQVDTQASLAFHLMVPKDARFFGAAKRMYYFLKGVER